MGRKRRELPSNEYLLVDGYNIINDWSALSLFREESMEHAREKLIELLSSYQGYRGINLIVVFDAHLVKGSRGKSYFQGAIQVIFTREGETADAVIERLVYQLSERSEITVATSDWEEQRIILGKGASRVSARELWDDLSAVRERIEQTYGKNQTNSPSNSVIDRIAVDKKKRLEEMRRKK